MVYVDRISTYNHVNNSATRMYGHRWSHLWADSTKELHLFADSIGLKRSWFQNKKFFPHYDIIPSKRILAIKKGAVEMSLKDFFKNRKSRGILNEKETPVEEPKKDIQPEIVESSNTEVSENSPYGWTDEDKKAYGVGTADWNR